MAQFARGSVAKCFFSPSPSTNTFASDKNEEERKAVRHPSEILRRDIAKCSEANLLKALSQPLNIIFNLISRFRSAHGARSERWEFENPIRFKFFPPRQQRSFISVASQAVDDNFFLLSESRVELKDNRLKID